MSAAEHGASSRPNPPKHSASLAARASDHNGIVFGTCFLTCNERKATMSIDTEPFDNSSATALLDEPQPTPAPAAPAKPKATRYQSLDMWRGLACLMLVIYHGTFYAEHSWRSG